MACPSLKESPSVIFNKGDYILNLPKNMERALRKNFPEFTAWESSDYTKSVVSNCISKSNTRAPFALIRDINKDMILDVIICGALNGKHDIICILSQDEQYKSVIIDTWNWCQSPEKHKSYNDSTKKNEIGFNYNLYPSKINKENPNIAFEIFFPQEINPKGELTHDGVIIEYYFINGVFEKKETTI